MKSACTILNLAIKAISYCRLPPQFFVCTMSVLLLGYSSSSAPNAHSAGDGIPTCQNLEIDALANEIWEWHLETDYVARVKKELPISTIADIDQESLRIDAARAQTFLNKLRSISHDTIDADRNLTRKYLIRYLEERARRPLSDQYSFDVTPYNGIFALRGLLSYPPNALLGTVQQRQNYLIFLNEFADRLDQIRRKTTRQAKAGIYLPVPAFEGAITAFKGLRAGSGVFLPGEERLSTLDKIKVDSFLADVNEIIRERIEPNYDAILAVFDDDYRREAPVRVGLSQYEGGREEYQKLIFQYTAQNMSAQEIHRLGKLKTKEISEAKAALRLHLGFDGSNGEFNELLREDSRFIAKSPQQLEDRYLSYLSRIEPLIDEYFVLLPKAPYGVKRLSSALERGQAFGFYQAPTPDEPRGLYLYNGSDLANRSMINLASLIYHELIPGHHFHFSLQQENTALPELRREIVSLSLSSFNEGWAEYASHLGYEMGLYDDPYDRYGRLLMESMLAARLVVDTGLNALGWSLEQARAYLREHTFLTEAEIASESVRYSTDIPGQALAYGIGLFKFQELRKRAETTLKGEFRLAVFHAQLLEQGAMPLDILEEHMELFFEAAASENEHAESGLK